MLKRIVLSGVVVLLLIAGAGYWWLFRESTVPADCTYALDLKELRSLAASLPGPRPSEIAVERLTTIQMPAAAAMAGNGWEPTQMQVFAYQLRSGDRTLILDTGMSEAQAKEAKAQDYDSEAYGRLSSALRQAALILVTHEHGDHLGGLVAQPELAGLAPAARLTRAQLSGTRSNDAKVPTQLSGAVTPLEYERVAAVAPGVVVIRATGHTPGSQMVFVSREDGRELLFLGDTSWKEQNVAQVRARPRLMTSVLLNGDRHQELCELRALHALHESAPEIRLVPGHDRTVIDALVSESLLSWKFH